MINVKMPRVPREPGLVPLNPLLLIGFGIVVGAIAFLAGCLIS